MGCCRRYSGSKAVTVELAHLWREELLAEGLSANTINKLRWKGEAIYKRAARVWKIATNPFATVERQPQRVGDDFNVLEPPETILLAAHAADEQDAAFYIVAAFTGLRLGELRTLQWRDLNFTDRLVHVRRAYTYLTILSPRLSPRATFRVSATRVDGELAEDPDAGRLRGPLEELPVWCGRGGALPLPALLARPPLERPDRAGRMAVPQHEGPRGGALGSLLRAKARSASRRSLRRAGRSRRSATRGSLASKRDASAGGAAEASPTARPRSRTTGARVATS